MYYTYSIEQVGPCYPRGDAGEMVRSGSEKPMEWIERNEELLEKTEKARRMVMELGRMGVLLITGSIIAILSLGLSPFLYFGFIGITLSYLFTTIRNSESLEEERLMGFMIYVVFLVTLTSPLFFLQNIGYRFESWQSLIAFTAVFIISTFFGMRESEEVIEPIRDHLSMKVEEWGRR